LARKIHGSGGAKGHQALEGNKRFEHSENKNKQLLRKSQGRKRKQNRKLVNVIKSIATPEILREWARKEQLTARKEVKERKIRQFTFYCRLLAIDALYLKHMPKRAIKINKSVTFRPPKKGTLSKAQKRDILEKLNGMETNQFNRKEQAKKQVEKLKKRLPKTIAKTV